jgi:large repetitive protein
MTPKSLLLPILLALGLASGAAAQTLTTSYVGFEDIDGNGSLSCDEPVTIKVVYATDNADPTELHATVLTPDSNTRGVTAFQTGSVAVDPNGTAGCTATITEGNDNARGDASAQVDIRCVADPMLYPGGTKLTFTYKSIYFSAVPQFTDSATAILPDRPAGPGHQLTARETIPTSSACAGAAPNLKITKTSMGPAIPGQTHIYSIAIANNSGLAQGGVYARDTVPANTHFDPANSSPGWFCSGGTGPGAQCSYLFNNLPTGTTTITYAVVVDSPIPPGVNNITNTACVAEVQTIEDCSSVADSFSSPPSITVTKSIIGGTPASPGSNVSFDIAVTSTGVRGTENVTVTDTLPPSLAYNSSGSSPWTCAGNTCTANTGSLAVGQTKHLSLVATVPNPLPAGGANYANQACGTPAEGGNPVCSSVTFGASGTPVLNLRKTLAQGDGTPDTDLAFSLTVRNDGDQDANPIQVNETVPAHTTVNLAASEPGWTCTGTSCIFSLPGLAAGSERTLRFATTVENPLPAGISSISNTACPSSSGAVTACDTITVTTRGQVILSVTKTLLRDAAKRLAKVLPGVVLRYSIAVTNTGNQDAADVTLTETVPNYTTFNPSASDPRWSCSHGGRAGDTCTLDVGPLGASSAASRVFSVLVGDPPANTDIRNSACVQDSGTSATGCGEVVTPPDSPTTLSASLSVTLSQDKDSSGGITPGDVLLYTAVIRNTGTAPAGGVVFMINAPDHTTLVSGSVTTTAGTVSTGNDTAATAVSVSAGNIAPGAEVTIAYLVTVPADLAQSVTQIVSQGDVRSSTAPAILTDDPSTPPANDPTIVAVRHLPQVPPANVPTLGQLGLTTLSLGLGACALVFIRKRRPIA